MKIKNILIRAKKPWVLPAIILIIGCLVFIAMHVYRVQASRSPFQEKQWPVHAITLPQASSHVPHLFLYGKVDHSSLVQLSSAVSTSVQEVLIKEGDQVTSGQLLIQLDDHEFQLTKKIHQADLTHVKSELASEQLNLDRLQHNIKHQKQLLDLVQASLKRYQSLTGQAYVSQEELNAKQREFNLRSIQYKDSLHEIDQSHQQLLRLSSRIEKVQHQVDQDDINIESCSVISPVSGQVTQLPTVVGEEVLSGHLLTEVMPTLDKEVHVTIPSIKIPIITQAKNNGDTITAEWRTQTNNASLSLIRLTPYVAPGQAGQEAIFSVNSDDAADFIMGTHAAVVINLPAVDNSFIVPESALYHQQQVYMIDNSRLRAVNVVVKGSIYQGGQRDYVVQSEELGSDQSILVSQIPQAVTGLKVSVIETSQGLNHAG